MSDLEEAQDLLVLELPYLTKRNKRGTERKSRHASLSVISSPTTLVYVHLIAARIVIEN